MKNWKYFPKKYLLPLIAGATMMSSCSKDDDPTPQQAKPLYLSFGAYHEQPGFGSIKMYEYNQDPLISEVNISIDSLDNDFSERTRRNMSMLACTLINYNNIIISKPLNYSGTMFIGPDNVDPIDSTSFVRLGFTLKLIDNKTKQR